MKVEDMVILVNISKHFHIWWVFLPEHSSASVRCVMKRQRQIPLCFVNNNSGPQSVVPQPAAQASTSVLLNQELQGGVQQIVL